MAAITPQYFALGVGAAGALVDVSSLVTGITDGVSRRYGQLDPFRDALPGTFSVVLDNYDGRFTPDNAVANAAAGYSTTVTEGMAACVQVGSRLTRGQVIGIRPLVGSNWGRIQITCDDVLGSLSRVGLSGAAMFSLTAEAKAFGFWPHNDPAGASSAADVSGAGAPSFRVPAYSSGAQFANMGYQASAGSDETRALMAADGTFQYWSTFGASFSTPDIPSGEAGVWGFRLEPLALPTDSTLWMYFTIRFQNGLVFRVSAGGSDSTDVRAGWLSGSETSISAPVSIGATRYYAVAFAVSGSNLVASVYADGALVATRSVAHSGATTAANLTPTLAEWSSGSGFQLNQFVISDVSWTERLVHGELVPAAVTVAGSLALATSLGGVTVSAPSGFGVEDAAPIDYQGSALEALNDVLRTEQGYAYPETLGTLTSNTETLVIRGRTRPTTVSASFDAVTELAHAPEFIRDLTNMVSSTTVVGPDLSVTVADPTLIARVGSKNDSDYTVLAEAGDLSLWGQDRLQRGANVSLRLASLVIDSVTTPTDRSADLLALVPGDRVRVTNLPDDILGFTEWDGWIVGGDERHNPTENRFEFSLAPVLPPVPVFNDARFAAGDSLTLSSTINNSVTSISVATTDATFTTDSADLPVDIVIDSEEMTVTAVSSATPQVFTVTRGVNGTTAASHSSGAQVELASVEPADDASVVVNRFLNPLFFGSSAPVNQANTTASIDTYSGSLMAKAVASSTANASMRLMPNEDRWAVSAGQFVYAAFTGYNAAAGSRTFQAVMRFYDTAGATLGTQLLAVTGGTVAIGAGASTLMSVSGTAPAFTQSVSVAFQRDATGSVGDTFYADGAVMSDQVVSPFGGDSTSSSTVLYSWAGPPNASPSYRVTQGQVQPATFGF